MRKMQLIRIKVNGTWVEANIAKNRTLVDFLRDDLTLTGTKKGCGTGDCGSCVVLIDGHARTTCNLPVYRVDGQEILTIEGLMKNGRLHPIQEAFIETGAIQCGYCTPGMVLRAKDLLDHHPGPTDSEIVDAISGHICRCTGYVKIMEAIRLASHGRLSSFVKEEVKT
jgi:aerobic carbon-monoxide dehydrogenase small subunit